MLALKSKIRYLIIILFFILSTVMLLPIKFLTSNEFQDNPYQCPYYISLQSVLANYSLLASDKANIKFIKNKMLKFEHEKLITNHQVLYYQQLSKLGINSISTVNHEALILLAAKNTYSAIDDYYFDQHLFCTNPLYNWKQSDSRRILNFNLSSLYDQIPNRYLRILSAVPAGPQLGVFSGFFVNNQTTTLVTQFMTGIPLLTALYVLPKYDFKKLGNYYAMVPWCYFNSGFLINPLLRKVLDISGIDIFTVVKSDLGKKNIPNAVPLKSNLNKLFDNGYESYINTQTYGMAYLAQNIYYIHPDIVKNNENIIKFYFAHADHHDVNAFRSATNVFYNQLMQLKNKHDIVLEANLLNLSDNKNKSSGSVLIKGIVGERALFSANCEREYCHFVANIANSPGWQAYVNGKAMPIERANFAFISTVIPSGKSTIWLIYSSWPQLISYFISVFSLLVIMFVFRQNKKVSDTIK